MADDSYAAHRRDRRTGGRGQEHGRAPPRRALGYVLVDTGALYRAVALAAQRAGVAGATRRASASSRAALVAASALSRSSATRSSASA